MLAALEPIFPLDPQTFLDGLFLSGLAFKSFQLFLHDFSVLWGERRNEPGIWIFDIFKVEMRILGNGLSDFCANVIRRLHDFPEGWFDDDLRFGFMSLEDDGTGMECSSQRRNQNYIDFLILHQLPGFFALGDAVFSDFDVEVLPVELSIQIGLTIEIVCSYLVLDLLLSEVVSRFCVSDEIDHFKQYKFNQKTADFPCFRIFVWILPM